MSPGSVNRAESPRRGPVPLFKFMACVIDRVTRDDGIQVLDLEFTDYDKQVIQSHYCGKKLDIETILVKKPIDESTKYVSVECRFAKFSDGEKVKAYYVGNVPEPRFPLHYVKSQKRPWATSGVFATPPTL
jgi:hypothetical protein